MNQFVYKSKHLVIVKGLHCTFKYDGDVLVIATNH